MAQIVDLGAKPLLRVLIFGIPGSTKTRTLGTAALDDRTSPVLWLDAGGNPTSLRDYNEHPCVIKVEELKDVNDPYDFLVREQPKDHKLVQQFPDLKEYMPFKSLVVDGVTDVHRLSFDAVLGTKNVGPGSHPPRAQRQHFGAVLSQMVTFGKLYYDLPVHVMMTCLETNYTEEATGREKAAPLLWGQTGNELPGRALAVGHVKKKATVTGKLKNALGDAYDDIEHSVVFWDATMMSSYPKDQYGSLPQFMADPSITKMLDLIYGEGT